MSDTLALIKQNGTVSIQLGESTGAAVSAAATAVAAAAALEEASTAQRAEYTLGRADAPTVGTNNFGGSTIVYAEPLEKTGQLERVRVWNNGATEFTLKLRTFLRTGTTLTPTGTLTSIVVPGGVGAHVIDLSTPMAVTEGEHFGFYPPAGKCRHQAVAPTDAYYSIAGDSTNAAFVDATTTTTVQLQLGFDFSYLAVTTERLDAIEADVADVATAKIVTDLITTDQVIGRTDTPITGTSAGNRTYAFGNPLAGDGYLDTFDVYAGSATTISLKRMTRSEDTFTQQGADLNLAVVAGLNSFTREDLEALQFQDGEYPGIYFPANTLVTTTNPADGSGWYSSDTSSGNLTEFTDLNGVTTTARIEARFGFKVVSTGGASGATQSSAVVLPKQRGCVGIHGYGARMALPFDNSTPKTFYMVMAVPAYFTGIRLILGHATTGVEMNIAKASIGLLTALADTTGATPHNSPVEVTFDEGQASCTIPVSPSGTNRAMKKSDLIPIRALPRTDGGTHPLLSIMAYVSTASTLKLLGKVDGTTDMTSWATPNADDMPMIYRYDDGDCVTTPANFTDHTNRSTGPILGVEFVADGQVISTMVFGDSLSNGEGTGIERNGLNFGFRAAFDMNDINGVCYSHFNAAWSGTQTVGFAGRMRSAFEAGVLPDVAIIQPFSPNNVSGGVITDAIITAMWEDMAEQLDLCAQYNVIPMLWTAIPNTLANYGTTDASHRQAFNTALRALVAKGMTILDFDEKLRSPTADGNGRYILREDITDALDTSDDDIHPDDSGIAEEAELVALGLDSLDLEWTGALITA